MLRLANFLTSSTIDVINAIVLPFIVALAVLWKFVIEPGFVFHGDFSPGIEMSSYLSLLQYSWNSIVGAPTGLTWIPGMIPLFLAKFLGMADDAAIRAWLFGDYVIAGSMMYITARILIPRYNNNLAYTAMYSVATIAFMVNRLTISAIATPNILLGYAALPLICALFIRAVNSKNNFSIFIYSCLTGLAFVFASLYPPSLFFAILFPIIYIIYRTLKIKRPQVFIKDLAIVCIVGGMVIGFNSFWFLQTFNSLISYPSNSETFFVITQSEFNVKELYMSWSAANGFTMSSIFNLTRDLMNPPFANLNTQVMAVSLIIPILAFVSLILVKGRSLQKLIISHTILAVVLIFFAARESPFINAIAQLSQLVWDSNISLRGPLWTLIKQPGLFKFPIIYVFSFLTGIFVFTLIQRVANRYSNIYLSFTRQTKFDFKLFKPILCIGILVGTMAPWFANAQPFSGNAWGYLEPELIPSDYGEVYNYFKNNDKQGRVWWLPIPHLSTYTFSWSNRTAGTHPVELGFSEKPMLMPTNPYAAKFIEYMYLQELLWGEPRNLGELLSALGVSSVILHTDVSTWQLTLRGDDINAIYSKLKDQRDLVNSYNTDFIHIFENKHEPMYLSANSNIAVMVGGYALLTSLVEREDFNASDHAIFFAEQFNKQTLQGLIKDSSVIFIDSNKGIEDLLLQFASRFVYPSHDYSSNGWDKVSDTPLFIYLYYTDVVNSKLHPNQIGDFLYGNSAVVSKVANSTFDLPISIKSADEYQIWIRAFKNQLGGILRVYLDGKEIGNLYTKSENAHLKWDKIGEFGLDTGNHKITIKSESGFNAVNVLSVISNEEFNDAKRDLIELVENKNTVIVKKIANLSSGNNHGDLFVNPAPEWMAGKRYIAQTFTADGNTISNLVIKLARWNPEADLLVSINQLDSKGIPDLEKPLVSFKLQAENISYVSSGDYRLLQDIPVEVGKPYALVLRQEADHGLYENSYLVYHTSNEDTYLHGFMIVSDDGGKSWVKKDSDIVFEVNYLPETILHLLNAENGSTNLIQKLDQQTNEAKILSYNMPQPGKYEIAVTTSKPFVLTLPQNFNDLWAIRGVENSIRFPSYSFLNSYYISDTGNLHITTNYAQNELFSIGSNLSVSFFIIIPAIALGLKIKARKSANYKTQ